MIKCKNGFMIVDVTTDRYDKPGCETCNDAVYVNEWTFVTKDSDDVVKKIVVEASGLNPRNSRYQTNVLPENKMINLTLAVAEVKDDIYDFSDLESVIKDQLKILFNGYRNTIIYINDDRFYLDM